MTIELDMMPQDAWVTYIAGSIDEPGWLEASDPISNAVGLSKRELLGLILYSYRLDDSGSIYVCWDSEDPEPNDGYLHLPSGEDLHCEHKVITQFDSREILDAITESYERYEGFGQAYGSGVHLILHSNQESVGLVKVSALHDAVGDKSYFDKVLMASVNGFEKNDVIRFALDEHFPRLEVRHLRIEKNTGVLLGPE